MASEVASMPVSEDMVMVAPVVSGENHTGSPAANKHAQASSNKGPESDISFIKESESLAILNAQTPPASDEQKKVQEMVKFMKILVNQNQQLKSALTATNDQLQEQIHQAALRKQQQEEAGPSDVVKKLQHSEQARKDLVHINQGLHRQIDELRKHCEALQTSMASSQRSNGSPVSVENGFCMVEPMSQSSQSQASVSDVEEGLSTMQLQSQQEEIETLQTELKRQKNMERQNSEMIESLLSEKNMSEMKNVDLEKKAKTLDELVSKLQSQVQSLVFDLNKLTGEHDRLSQAHQALQITSNHQLNEQQSRLIKQQDTIGSLQGMIKDFETDKTEYQQKYMQMQAELRQRNSQLSELRKDHHALCMQHQETRDLLQEENRKLQLQLNSTQQNMKQSSELKNEVEAYKAQAEYFRADFQAERKAREEAQTKVTQLEEKLKEMQEGAQRNVSLLEENNARSINEIRQRHGRVPVTPIRVNAPLVRREPPLDPGFSHAVQQDLRPARPPQEPVHMEGAPSRAQELTCPKCKIESPDEDSFHLHLADCIQ